MARILVTGGAGFVAHHIIDHILSTTDHEVVSLDRLDTSGTLNRLCDIIDRKPGHAKRLTVVWHDLKAPLNEFVRKKIGRVQYLLHLAAGSHVDRSIEYPMEFIMDNVVGTCNLLDYCRLYLHGHLKKFLYFSTDEVFGPAPEGVFYKEWDRYHSGNPYSASKAGAEELCLAYENTYKIPIIITHTMNVFGIRQHPEKFIPMVIRKVLLGHEVTIHADSSCTKAGCRHYINTSDVADGVMFLLEHGQPGDKYNLVGERELDNLELAQTIASIMELELHYKMVDFHSSRPGHDLRYALDGSKMEKMGWTPRRSVTERLREVVNWSAKNPYWLGLGE